MNWRDSETYTLAMEQLQRGNTTEALQLLHRLQNEFPEEEGVRLLVTETELRAEAARKGRVRGSRRISLSRRGLIISVLLLLVVVFALSARSFYQGVIVPSLEQTKLEAQQETLVNRAEQALTTGDYTTALASYDQLAQLNPNHPALADGVARAKQTEELDALYQRAQAALDAGDISAAQASFVSIQEIAPNYRDVAAQLETIEQQQRLARALTEVEKARDTSDLETLLQRLEEARSIAPKADRSELDNQLFDVYVELGRNTVDQSEGQPEKLNLADAYFTDALALRPQAAEASVPRELERQYLQGYNSYSSGNWDTAIGQLQLLYDQQPDYIQGRAAQLLYDAFMKSGDALQQADEISLAWDRYYRASLLVGVDTTTARALAASLSTQMTPTVTPTPTVTMTPVPTSTPVPPTPQYVSLVKYKGKIVYYSDRDGTSNLWIMDADGHNPFSIWDQGKAEEEYNQLKEAELRSPDGKAFLYVTKPRGEDFPQIFIQQPDGKATRLTDFYGQNYDPVWSPSGHWIAYVSNEVGNDEIFLIGDDGEHPKRLTWNEWEWDKHPSWAPQGGRLVFWSNRVVGHAQIWLMNDDGTGQVNLSNNEFDERDPIWIK